MGLPNAAPIDSLIGDTVDRVRDDFVGAIEITPSDTAALSTIHVRALLVGVTGNVKVTMYDDTVVTLPLVAGVVYKVIVKLVWSSGTTATGIVGLY